MNILNIIFFATMYPIVLVMYVVLRNLSGKEDGLLFGASMKKEWRSESEFVEIEKWYKKSLNRFFLIIAIIPVVCILIHYVSIAYTIWMHWFLVMIFGPLVIFAIANKKVKDEKEKKGYVKEASGNSYTELKQAGEIRRVHIKSFLAPIVVSFLAVVFVIILSSYRFTIEASYELILYMVITMAIMTPFFYITAIWMDRRKIEIISTDSDVNINFARAKKNVWKNLWMIAAWINTAFVWVNVVLAFLPFSYAYSILVSAIIYSVILIVLILLMWKKYRKVKASYSDKHDFLMTVEDEDRYWIGGILYCNKNDKHLFRENRVGMGTTINLAHKAGKVLEVVGLACLLIIPVTSVWMMFEEFTPLQLYLESDTIIAKQINVDYEIPVEDITYIEMIEELPEMTKINGSGMDNLLKGKFEIFHQGCVQVFLNPQTDCFIYLETNDTHYYLGASTKEETVLLYEELVDEK